MLLRLTIALLPSLLLASLPASADAATEPCRLKGIEREVRCGRIAMPEDPDSPAGRRIDIHYAVVPALARIRAPDPLFVLAGGPGQSARAAAGRVLPLFARLNARRDIVFVDQRGTGASNPLDCKREQTDPVPSIAELIDAGTSAAQARECLRRLRAGNTDLRQYATWIAVRDLDAVREALGYARINLWGASYGTRAALEYLRQFPQRVRSIVLDGVAPADMALPASFAVDSQASLDSLLKACATQPSCAARHADAAGAIERLFARAESGSEVELVHPLTGRRERVVLQRQSLTSLLRAPLYAPQLATVLPFALAEAGRDNLAPLLALGTSLAAALEDFAAALHFAVICAEDLPRLDAAARGAAAATRFGDSFIAVYEEICREVPTRAVPAGFYAPPAADVPVLILSGGVDPATPPRHGEAVAKRLARAAHAVAPQLGHGISQHGCAPDLIDRFVREADAAGLPLDCLQSIPAPPPFAPPSGRRQSR